MLSLMAVASTFSACSLLPMLNTQEEEQEPLEVEIEQTKFAIPAEGGEFEVSFVPTSDWEVECDAEWIECDPMLGTASEDSVTVTFTVEPNYAEKRKAKIYIAFETNEVSIRVDQNAYTGNDDPGNDDPGNDDPSTDNPGQDPGTGDSDGKNGTEDVVVDDDLYATGVLETK